MAGLVVFSVLRQTVFAAESRTLSFSGYTWTVKSGREPLGPGPNYFSDSRKNVWVDEAGRLHLKITRRFGRWACSEVICRDQFGYGRYVFRLASRVDKLSDNVIMGLFTWDTNPGDYHREIDIEFCKWGGPTNDAQYVVQPWDRPGNLERFVLRLDGERSTHGFDWQSHQILFESFQGHGPLTPQADRLIRSWTYRGRDVPRIGREKVRMNLWLRRGRPPEDGRETEVIIETFEFIPS